MKIWMHRFIDASAYSYLTIDESLLKNINEDLACDYVLASNLYQKRRGLNQ